MSLEAWGDSDEDMRAPDGYVTEEQAEEMAQEAALKIMNARDLIAARLEAYRAAHGGADGVPPPGYQSGFYAGMSEALQIVLMILAE